MKILKIANVIEKINTLPPLPQAVQKLYSLAGNLNNDIHEMSNIISNDQALTAKILRVVNSAFYGLSQKVSSVTQALVILGFNEIRNLSLSLSIIKITKNMGANSVLKSDEFWKHSISVAICAKIIAKKLKLKDPEEAFVSGLLHDIGKLIFIEYFNQDYDPVIKSAMASGALLHKQERLNFNISHADLGFELCKYWKLPPIICTAIQKHHDIITGESTADEKIKMTLVVKAGNNLSKLAHIGSSGDLNVDENLFSSDSLPLHTENIKNILLQLQDEVDKVEHSFDLKKEQ